MLFPAHTVALTRNKEDAEALMQIAEIRNKVTGPIILSDIYLTYGGVTTVTIGASAVKAVATACLFNPISCNKAGIFIAEAGAGVSLAANPAGTGKAVRTAAKKVGQKFADLAAKLNVPAGAARVMKQKLPNAGSVSHVNPTRSKFNCTNCAFSVDNQLATGAKSSALPREKGVPFSELNKLYGTQFSNDMSRHQIENLLRSYGDGTRAIIYGVDETGKFGHVWNAIVQKGIVNYIDGQTGKGGAKNFDIFNRNLRVGITKKGIEND